MLAEQHGRAPETQFLTSRALPPQRICRRQSACFTEGRSLVFPRYRESEDPQDRGDLGPRGLLPFCVVYCRSSQNDPHSGSGAVEVIDGQCLFVGGSANNEHDDVLRPVIMTETECHRLSHERGF